MRYLHGGKGTLGGGKSKSKGLEAGLRLVGLRSTEKARSPRALELR